MPIGLFKKLMSTCRYCSLWLSEWSWGKTQLKFCSILCLKRIHFTWWVCVRVFEWQQQTGCKRKQILSLFPRVSLSGCGANYQTMIPLSINSGEFFFFSEWDGELHRRATLITDMTVKVSSSSLLSRSRRQREDEERGRADLRSLTKKKKKEKQRESRVRSANMTAWAAWTDFKTSEEGNYRTLMK